jgi:hypothetical protein
MKAEAGMNPIQEYENRLPDPLRAVFTGLKTPPDIQAYLDSLPYRAEDLDRSPLRVMTDGQCHCLDGGLFAALALWKNGFPPLLIDLVPDPGRDDDHVLALYRIDGLWGAIAKSNYPNLRFREPVYRNLRELAMSYFEHFYNLDRCKTLRGYTRPFRLDGIEDASWMWDEEAVRKVTKRFYSQRSIPLISAVSAARLSIADERSYTSGTYGTDFSWSFGNRPEDKA